MNKKTILYVLLPIAVLGLVNVGLFKPSNSVGTHEAQLMNLQALEKIAETGDMEAQLRLVDFYKSYPLRLEYHKTKEDYWSKKIEPRKTTDEYNKVVAKLAEERAVGFRAIQEKSKKIQEKMKVFAEKHKNLDPKDKQANDNALLKSVEILSDNVYSWKDPYTWRYRLTINIETPEGIKSGSTIQEIYYPPADSKNIHNPANQGIARGEAAYIDLGQRGVMVAIMQDPSNARERFKLLIRNVFPTVPTVYDLSRFQEMLKHYNDIRNVKDEVQPWLYPTLVGFRDINDPKTIELIYQRKHGSVRDMQEVETDRLEEFYGKGVKIQNMTLEMTDDPLEWKLDDKLNWIETMDEKDITHSLHEVVPRIPITNGIAYYIFRQGFEKHPK